MKYINIVLYNNNVLKGENFIIRLWHHKLIPFLPKKQLVSQWREYLVVIASEYRSLLIKHVDGNPKSHLVAYGNILLEELSKRNVKLKPGPYQKYLNFIGNDTYEEVKEIFPNHDTDRHLIQCFYNLQEKYDCGQKGFSKEEYERLYNFVSNEVGRIL